MSRRLGAFEIGEVLGEGGMGTVWAGVHLPTGTPVALKALRQGASATRAAFEQEISAVATLHHPGVVRILDRGVAADGEALPTGAPWFAMERADRALVDLPPEPWPRLQALLLDLLDALGHVHGHGVLHRDVKAANVLRIGGRFVLSDLGMATVADAAGERGGTPGRMPPEQQAGRRDLEGPWTDLFALGHLAADRAAGAADLPAGFEGWVGTLREPDLRRRFRSAAEAAHALRSLGGGAGSWCGALAGEAPTAPSATVATAIEAVPALWHPLPPIDPIPPRRLLPHPLPAGLGAQLLTARTTPVLGRDRERARLWEALCRATDGRSARIALQGPAGVGKSRLAGWIAAEAHGRGGADVIRVRYGGADPLGRALARWATADEARLRRLLVDLGEDGERAEVLASWLGGGAAAPAMRGRLARELLGAFARRRRLVLLLDDVQEAEPDELAALLALRGHALIVATHKPTLDGAALDAAFEVLHLDALDEDTVLEMLEQFVGLAPALAVEVSARCGGNPGLAALRIAGPLARGALVPGPKGLVLAPGAELDPPAAAVDLWARHLDGLDDADVDAVAIAAALGDPFALAEWQAMARPRDGLLEALVRRHLWAIDGDRARFTHGLLQEAALAHARRRGALPGLHARIESWLRDHDGDPARIGAHALAAGRPEEAAPLLRRALFLAINQARLVEADRLDRQLDRALSALPSPHPLRGEHLVERGRLHWLRYRLDDARTAALQAEAALRAAGDPAFRAVVYWLQANIALTAGEPALAREAIGRALAVPGVAPGLVLRLERMLGRCAREEGDAAGARLHLMRALELAEAAGERHGVLDAVASLAVHEHLVGRLDEALVCYDRALDLASELGSGFAVAENLLNRAQLRTDRGELEQAGEDLDRATRMIRRLGREDDHARIVRALLLRAAGQRAAARRLLESTPPGDRYPIASLLLLEELAADGDADGWDLRVAALTDDALGPDADLVSSGTRALQLALERGWTERAARLRPRVEQMRAMLERLRGSELR